MTYAVSHGASLERSARGNRAWRSLMTPPMIESSDRGITLNKSLAWTILATAVGVAFWFGTRDAEQTTAIETLSERQAEDRLDIRANRTELAEARRVSTRLEQRLIAIHESQQDIVTGMQELETFIRDIGRGGE